MSHFVQELQQLKANMAEMASLTVGSKAEKDSLCRDTQQMVSYYDGLRKNLQVHADWLTSETTF